MRVYERNRDVSTPSQIGSPIINRGEGGGCVCVHTCAHVCGWGRVVKVIEVSEGVAQISVF